MKNKKVIIFFVLLLLLAIIIGVGYVIIKKIDESKQEEIIDEYTPQEEISEEQLRQTLVTLYFKNKETSMLMPEARMIDAKLLINNPYLTLVEMLIGGPKNEKLEKAIPINTKVNNVELKGDIVYVDFSSEFIAGENLGAEAESNIVYSVVNTLTELTEVRGIKILIDGKENLQFSDGAINFKEIFVKK